MRHLSREDVVDEIAGAIQAAPAFVRNERRGLVDAIMAAPDQAAVASLLEAAMPDAEWRDAADRIEQREADAAVVQRWADLAPTEPVVNAAWSRLVDEEATSSSEADLINRQPVTDRLTWLHQHGLDDVAIDLALRDYAQIDQNYPRGVAADALKDSHESFSNPPSLPPGDHTMSDTPEPTSSTAPDLKGILVEIDTATAQRHGIAESIEWHLDAESGKLSRVCDNDADAATEAKRFTNGADQVVIIDQATGADLTSELAPSRDGAAAAAAVEAAKREEPATAPPIQEAPKLRSTGPAATVGQLQGMPAQIRVIFRRDDTGAGKLVAEPAPIKLRAIREADGKISYRIPLGDKQEGEAHAPSLFFAGEPKVPASFKDASAKFGDATYEGPLFGAANDKSEWVTPNPHGRTVDQRFRAVVISMPDDLYLQTSGKTDAAVLSQGHEAIRIQEGAKITKAVVVIPVEKDGRPKETTLTAYRAFTSKNKTYQDGTKKTFLTPKFTFTFHGAGDQGGVIVREFNGKQAVADYKQTVSEVKKLLPDAVRRADPDGMVTKAKLEPLLAEKGYEIRARKSGQLEIGKKGSRTWVLVSNIDQGLADKLKGQYPIPQPAGPQRSAGQSR